MITPPVGNPYHEAIRQIDSRILRDSGPEDFNLTMDLLARSFEKGAFQTRTDLVAKFAWAIPTDSALDAITAASRHIVEIGAGSGYWAALLTQRGCNVVAYDNFSWSEPDGIRTGAQDIGTWHPVTKASWRAAGKHPDRALMLCWPPYDKPMAYNAVRAYYDAGGHTIIYIGEGYGGCTADDRFHAWLEKHAGESEHVRLPQWPGIHDGLYLYTIPGRVAPQVTRARRAFADEEERA